MVNILFFSLYFKCLVVCAEVEKSLLLQVYEQCLTTLRIPKSMLNGADVLLMGFPQCGSYYYLLMQLDKDFRPLFNLLESQPEPHGMSHSIGEANHVFRLNKIDINMMQMIEDESNLALLDWEKLQSLPNLGASNTVPEQSLLSDFGMESTSKLPGCSQLNFSSVVDEVFKFEKVKSDPSFPIQSHSSSPFNASSYSHLSSLSTSHQGMKAGINIPKLDGGMQHSQISNATKVSTGASSLNSSLYGGSSLKGILHTNTLSSSSPGRNSSVQKLSLSKSDQDLSSLRSTHLGELGQYSAVDGDQSRSVNDSPKDVGGLIGTNRVTQPLSPLRASGSRMHTIKANGLKSLSAGAGGAVGFSKDTGSSSLITASMCKISLKI